MQSQEKVAACSLSWWRAYGRDCAHLAVFALFHLGIAGICQLRCLCALRLAFHFPESFFSFMLWLAHYGCLFAGSAIILMLFRLFGKRFSLIVSLLIGWLILLALILDTGVFVLWRFHINLPMITLFCSSAGSELVNFPVTMYVIGIFGIIAALGGEVLLWYLSRKFFLPKTLLILFCVMIVNFVGFQAWNAWMFFHSRNSYMIRTESVPFFFGLTANGFLLEHGFVQENSAVQLNDASGKLHYPREPLRFTASLRPDVLMIVVDSLRADNFSAEVMPKLFRRMKTDGAFFTRHYSGGNCTRTGMMSLFYGIPGTYWNAALKSNTPSIVMQAALAGGYDIGVFSGAVLTNPELHQTIFSEVPNLQLIKRNGSWVTRDQAAIADLLNFLQKNQAKKRDRKPFFAVLLLDSLHANAVPPGYPKRFPTDMDNMNFMMLNNNDPTLVKRIQNLYRNCSCWIDDELEDALQKFSATGALQNAIVLLTSDHGQEANETRTNSWEHNSNYSRFQIQTPLVIWGLPGRQGIYSHLTTHMDVPVTLLRAMGCENAPSDYSTGKDLFDPSERGTIVLSSYTNRAIFYDGKILDITQNGVVLSYDLDGHEVPSSCTKTHFLDALEQMKRFAQ